MQPTDILIQPAKTRISRRLLIVSITLGMSAAGADPIDTSSVDELNTHIEQLNLELEAARSEAAALKQSLTEQEAPPSDKIKVGAFTIGGAMRVNYVNGDYVVNGDAPQRGGNGGNFELDTFRINASLDYDQLIGKFEYRWYNGYNFLHTGWLGYDFKNAGEIQAGVTRVPFGPGPYGASQSWFFDQHYYLGLADDMDLGIKYLFEEGNWDIALAYFISSEGNWNGASEDSARYSYDIVRWTSALQPDGSVVSAPVNGYEERNQFNVRAIYKTSDIAVPTDIGISLQYGELKGTSSDDGNHWAASGHMVNRYNNFTLATQITRLEIDISNNNPLATDELIPMGAYDFAWPATTMAWIPAVSLSYRYDATTLPWLDYILPYVEYSNIIKDGDSANDSDMLTLGAAWASGGWYIYSDLVYSTGNLFIGNIGDDYSNVYQGVGDFGANGNDRRNMRFNINFGYYF